MNEDGRPFLFSHFIWGPLEVSNLHERLTVDVCSVLIYSLGKGKGKVHSCTGTEALYTGRAAHRGSRVIALLFLDHGTRTG